MSANTPLLGKLLLKLLAEIESNPAIFQVFYKRLIAPRFAWVTQMIERAQARGELRTDIEPGLIISLLAGPFYFNFIFLSGFTGTPSSTLNAEQIVDAVLRGISALPPHDTTTSI